MVSRIGDAETGTGVLEHKKEQR